MDLVANRKLDNSFLDNSDLFSTNFVNPFNPSYQKIDPGSIYSLMTRSGELPECLH